MRAHSSEKRYALRPSVSMRSRSSSKRFQESQASPHGSTTLVPGARSKRHQSEFVLPPSIWYAEVAVPHEKVAGNRAWRLVMSLNLSPGRTRRGD
jgi:hypothetical protein